MSQVLNPVLESTEISENSFPKENSVIRAYYELTKPGIMKMVVLSTAAGFYLGVPNFSLFLQNSDGIFSLLFTIIGTVLICSGSGVFNQYLESDIDARMQRTKNRPIPSGIISKAQALIFGLILFSVGASLLFFVNFSTFVLAISTVVLYIAIYTPMKRKSILSLVVGAVPGALPPLGGWVAARGSFDLPGIIIFFILFYWQMPHFLALSWMYKKDYKDGNFEMIAVKDQTGKSVALQSLLYSIVLSVISIFLFQQNVTGWIYLIGSVLLGIFFIYRSYEFYQEITHQRARNLLLASYAYLMGIFLLMFIDKV